MKMQEVEQLRLIFDNIPHFIWIKDELGRYVTINKKFKKFGISHNVEIIGNTDFDIFSEEIAILCKEADKQAIKTKQPQSMEQYYPGKKGVVWFETYVTPIFAEGGKVLGTIGISKKISRRKRLETELSKQKEFLKWLLDAIPDFIFYKDQNSKYLGCNTAFAEKFVNLTEDQIIGKTDFEIMENQELAYSLRQDDQEVLTKGTSQINEKKFISVDGHLIDVETILTPFSFNGKTAGLIGISRNITARKELEEAWRQQKDYAELLLSVVPSMVFSVDLNNKVTSWNKQAEVLTGFARNQVIGQKSSEFLPAYIISAELLLMDIEEQAKVISFIDKHGVCRHMLRHVAGIKNSSGKLNGKIIVLHDVSKMIKCEAELRENQERYAAIVNHTPLIVLIHVNGVIKFINEAGLIALGYVSEEMIDKHLSQFLAAAGNQEELDLIKKNGQKIRVLFKESNVMYEGHSAQLVVFIDQTEKKNAEKRLQESENKLRQISDNISEIFAIRDKDKIEYVNSAFERIVGLSVQGIQYSLMDFFMLVHPEDRERVRSLHDCGDEHLYKEKEQEFRIIRPDGQLRWLWMRSYPIYKKDGTVQQKAVTFTDITDRKLIENTLRQRELETQREQDLAAKVQQNYLPKFFQGERVKVDKIFIPQQTVSGDLLNYKWFIGQEKLCGYVVDVSGHGMATALQTAAIKMLLDNRLLGGGEIDLTVFQFINQNMLPYLYEDSFAGLLYFEFDFKTNMLTVISAGVTLFLVAKKEELLLKPVSGCYLGIFEKTDVGMTTMSFQAGDMFFMMSDGLSDLIEQFSLQKQKSFAGYKNWLEKLAKYREDDCSCICVEVLRQNKNANVFTIQNARDLCEAQLMIEKFLTYNAGQEAGYLEVVANEAINNAMRVSERVRIKMQKIGSRVIFRIKDYGEGFTKSATIQNINKIALNELEQELEELLLAESGRGILIMKLFCDYVLYNKRGNEVLLMKQV